MTGTEAEDGPTEAVGEGERRAAPSDSESESPALDVDVDSDPEAFQALGNEVRLSVLRHLLDREQRDRPTATFSELQDATGADTSAGFAYHLRQLTDRYVRNVEGEDGDSDTDDDPEGYGLTYAGRKVARAVSAGTFTESVDLAPVELDDPCPHCGEASLVARCRDNVVGVACGACGRPVLSLPFPPQGYRDRPPSAVPRAFDRHHRHRFATLREGVCPECAGRVEGTVAVPGAETGVDRPGVEGIESDLGGAASDAADRIPGDPADDADRPVAATDGSVAGELQATFECDACGHATATPVTLSLLSHPAVVAFYHDHGIDVRERPLWNVGEEWRETLLSTDPLAVVVSTRLDDELLELYVDRCVRVVDHRRTTVGAAS